MPSQDSTTPSPLKRPSINQRTSSTASLSSSQKHQHKVHRSHVVGHAHAHAHRAPHGRNPSYGKNLNKLNRLSSQSHIAPEGRNHQRKKSGPPGAEALSPKSNVQKNTSHVSLPKVASHASIKKNQSTVSIARNTSAGQLKKQGLAPLTAAKYKEKENTIGGFQLGDNSSSEEEAEWEDSSASPNTTRKNSTAEGIKHEQEASDTLAKKHSSPPAPSLKDQHRSAPSLATKVSATPSRPPEDAPNFLRDSRSTRAPPAMSSIAAVARPPSSANLRGGLGATESTDQSNGASSSMENGVSRFVNGSLGANGTPRTPDVVSDDDDYDSPSSFLPHYHPQAPAVSPHDPSRSSSGQLSRRANPAGLPSRTQQRLELQRRETMRASPTPPESDPMEGPLALRTRSASRGRNRNSQDTVKVAKKDFESANAQLEVIKRYRNPMVEALSRLQDRDIIPKQDDKASVGGKSRPVSRAGSRRQSLAKAQMNAAGKQPQQTSQNARPTNGHRRVTSRGRVRFERQGSHEDIGLSRSQGQDDLDEADQGDGLDDDAVNAEEALLRRMWESREVYEA